jgi:ankyrin repeat protein
MSDADPDNPGLIEHLDAVGIPCTRASTPVSTEGVQVWCGSRGGSSGSSRGSSSSSHDSAAALEVAKRRQVQQLLSEAGAFDALVSAVLEFPKDPLHVLKNADCVKELARLLKRRRIAERIAEVVCAAARRARQRKADADAAKAGAGPSGKFQGLVVAAYGGAAEFREGIDALGIPRADIRKGMEDDMKHSADSYEPFQTTNYGGTWSTPATEWEFVMHPKIGQIYPGRRKPVRIEIFYFACCALRSTISSVRLFPSMVTWAPFSTTLSCSTVYVSGVKDAAGNAHAINSSFVRTTQVVNGLPMFAQTGGGVCLWWCGGKGARDQKFRQTPLSFNERENLKAQRRKASGLPPIAQEQGEAGWPAWIFGKRESVGSNRGMLFIYSSEARPEQTPRRWHFWDGEEWKEDKQIRVVEEEDADSDAVRWMDYKSALPDMRDQDAVELVVLQRFVTQLNLAILKEALAQTPGTLDPDKWTEGDVAKLQARLDRALGAQGGGHGAGKDVTVCTVPCAEMAAVVADLQDLLDGTQLQALIVAGRNMLKSADFAEEEVVALRCYTGCTYMKINGALRQSSRQMPEHLFAGLKGNKYVSIMHALVSGVIKLSLICILPANGEVFRGLSGFELPRCFHEPDRFGARGGVDFAFMSCTTDMKVALDYSKGDGALVFRISVGMIDRGADLRFLSQYPGEREIVMPPRSCLEVRGEPHMMSTDHGDVVILDAAINCNLSCRTLEKTKAQRKDLCVSLIDTLAKEVSRDIKTQSHAPEFVERTKRDVFWEREKSGEIFLNSITDEISRMTDIYRERSTEWYHNDAHLQKAVTDALPLPSLARAKLRLYKDDPFLFCYQATVLTYQAVARREIARRRGLLEQARAAGDTAALIKMALEESKEKGWVLEAVDEINAAGETPLLTKCAEGDMAAAGLLIEAGANTSASTTSAGSSALHLAAENGALDVVRLLLRSRVDVNAVDFAGTTALYQAASGGHIPVIEELIAAQAEINVQITDDSSVLQGCTALHMACYGGHADAAYVLIQAKADLNIRDSNGATPLQSTCYKGYSHVLERLIECKAPVNVQTKRGRSPLHHASANGHAAVVQLLIAAKSNLDCVEFCNRGVALHDAAAKGHLTIVSMLVEANARVDVCNEGGVTPLAAASAAGHLHVAAFLSKHVLLQQAFHALDPVDYAGGQAQLNDHES